MFNEELHTINESLSEDCKRLQSQYQQLKMTMERCSQLSTRLLSDSNRINSQNLMKNIATHALKSFGSNGSDSFGSISKIIGLISGFHKNARASGGNVMQGVPYLVGERGPEMFVPNSGGNILSNGSSSSGKPINIVMNINATDAGSFQKSKNQIISELARAVRGAKNI